MRAWLKAFADETRLRILGLVAERAYSASELAERLEMKPQDVVRHLSMLAEYDLIVLQMREGVQVFQLNIRALHNLNRVLAGPPPAHVLPEAHRDDWIGEIFRNFFEGDRLKSLPAQPKKADVIIVWFAERFQPGVYYSEKQVNEMIQRHYEDYATVRRSMIDMGLMTRENGVYWRTTQAAAGR